MILLTIFLLVILLLINPEFAQLMICGLIGMFVFALLNKLING